MPSTERRHWRLSLVLGAILAVGGCQGAATSPGGPSAAASVPSAMPTGDVLAEARLAVDQRTSTSQWSGPPTGVKKAVSTGAIYFVAADMKNGGIAALWTGVSQAAAAMGWDVVKRDGTGSAEVRADALQSAISANPLAIIVGGFVPTEHPDLIAAAKAGGAVVVGWHAGSAPGPDPAGLLFTNVSTQPSDVAMLAADEVIAHSNGHAGVAIFTDSQYQIALDKANIMQTQIERCLTCQVLAYRDTPIADAAGLMPDIVHDLRTQFGGALNYLLAINGNYFAGSEAGLQKDGVAPNAAPWAVAAGDGDQAEFDRIRASSYQLASVAEPLYLQGWQLVDEINRALAHQPPSGWTPKPGLITAVGVPEPGAVWDPNSAYRDTYKRLWGVAP